MEAIVLTGTFGAAEFFSFPSPRSAPRYYPVTEVYRQFLALTCAVTYKTLSRQVCDFPNDLHSTEFTTGGPITTGGLGRIKLWKNLQGDQWKPAAPMLSFNCHGKGCKYLLTK